MVAWQDEMTMCRTAEFIMDYIVPDIEQMLGLETGHLIVVDNDYPLRYRITPAGIRDARRARRKLDDL